jgi:Gpi18-like mannosyltransferase
VTSLKNNALKITAILLIFLSVALRVISIPHSNRDMVVYNLLWYQTLYQKGIGEALATNFSNYTPPYTYFLTLATLTHDFIPPLVAIKLIPICFDFLGAFYTYKIIKLKYQQGDALSCGGGLFHGSKCHLNSAYWGHGPFIIFLLFVCISVDRSSCIHAPWIGFLKRKCLFLPSRIMALEKECPRCILA